MKGEWVEGVGWGGSGNRPGRRGKGGFPAEGRAGGAGCDRRHEVPRMSGRWRRSARSARPAGIDPSRPLPHHDGLTARREAVQFPTRHSPIAQSVERAAVNRQVAGSSPAGGACEDPAAFAAGSFAALPAVGRRVATPRPPRPAGGRLGRKPAASASARARIPPSFLGATGPRGGPVESSPGGGVSAGRLPSKSTGVCTGGGQIAPVARLGGGCSRSRVSRESRGI